MTDPKKQTEEAHTVDEDVQEALEESEFQEEALSEAAAEGMTPPPADENSDAALKDQLMRALAEMENTKRRAERDKQEAFKYAVTNFARDLLSVADNFERALAAAPKEVEDAGLKNFITGVEMTAKELQTAFDKHGIKQVDSAPGTPFDYNVHQAMSETEDPTQPAGTIVQTLAPGFQIKDRLLRPAMVVVSKGGAANPDADDVPHVDQEV